VAIARGGTTSLAEQQLFGLKKVIVPIPWTHDQLKNAQYYVKTYDDILVRQDVA
jgi:UDP-N-acetylglucosamine:LPS N-acetylglucosamine transferase